MVENHFSETSSTGWLGRIGSSIKGVFFGLLLLVISVPVLFFNEGRARKTYLSLAEGAKSVVSVSPEKPEAKNEGKLIHFTGKAETQESIQDSKFKITAKALKLRRKVEYFQWEEQKKTETKKKLGGSEETVTTYDYSKKWGDELEDSSTFKHPQGHENPRPVLNMEEWVASPVTVGGFSLSPALVKKIDNYTAVSGDAAAELPETIAGKKIHREGAGFYLGDAPAAPQIGDLRVTHQAALPGNVSIVAAQAGASLAPFTAKAGGVIELLETGNHKADAMFATAQKNNTLMTWALRALGAVLMFFGFAALFRPLSILADVLPIAGDIVGVGTGLIALLLTLVISSSVIAVAWIFYRPLLGIPLVLLAVTGFVCLVMKLMAQRKGRVSIG